jgi:hypothetical protein
MLIRLQERQLSLNQDGSFRNARLEQPGEHLGVLLRHLGGLMLSYLPITDYEDGLFKKQSVKTQYCERQRQESKGTGEPRQKCLLVTRRTSERSLISVVEYPYLRNRYHAPLFRRFHCRGPPGRLCPRLNAYVTADI